MVFASSSWVAFLLCLEASSGRFTEELFIQQLEPFVGNATRGGFALLSFRFTHDSRESLESYFPAYWREFFSHSGVNYVEATLTRGMVPKGWHLPAGSRLQYGHRIPTDSTVGARLYLNFSGDERLLLEAWNSASQWMSRAACTSFTGSSTAHRTVGSPPKGIHSSWYTLPRHHLQGHMHPSECQKNSSVTGCPLSFLSAMESVVHRAGICNEAIWGVVSSTPCRAHAGLGAAITPRVIFGAPWQSVDWEGGPGAPDGLFKTSVHAILPLRGFPRTSAKMLKAIRASLEIAEDWGSPHSGRRAVCPLAAKSQGYLNGSPFPLTALAAPRTHTSVGDETVTANSDAQLRPQGRCSGGAGSSSQRVENNSNKIEIGGLGGGQDQNDSSSTCRLTPGNIISGGEAIDEADTPLDGEPTPDPAYFLNYARACIDTTRSLGIPPPGTGPLGSWTSLVSLWNRCQPATSPHTNTTSFQASAENFMSTLTQLTLEFIVPWYFQPLHGASVHWVERGGGEFGTVEHLLTLHAHNLSAAAATATAPPKTTTRLHAYSLTTSTLPVPPPQATLHIYTVFLPAAGGILHGDETPPDAARGLEVPPARLSLSLGGHQWAVYLSAMTPAALTPPSSHRLCPPIKYPMYPGGWKGG